MQICILIGFSVPAVTVGFKPLGYHAPLAFRQVAPRGEQRLSRWRQVGPMQLLHPFETPQIGFDLLAGDGTQAPPYPDAIDKVRVVDRAPTEPTDQHFPSGAYPLDTGQKVGCRESLAAWARLAGRKRACADSRSSHVTLHPVGAD
jgi:hypothetical protein